MRPCSTKVIHRVQVAIPEILIQRSVKAVGPALDRGIELTAGGVAELGAELVLQQEKFSTASLGTPIRSPVTDLLLLSTPSTVNCCCRAAGHRPTARHRRPCARLCHSRTQQRKVQNSGTGAAGRVIPRSWKTRCYRWPEAAPWWCRWPRPRRKLRRSRWSRPA